MTDKQILEKVYSTLHRVDLWMGMVRKPKNHKPLILDHGSSNHMWLDEGNGDSPVIQPHDRDEVNVENMITSMRLFIERERAKKTKEKRT